MLDEIFKGIDIEDEIVDVEAYQYDIVLNGTIVGDQGTEYFDTKDEAREHAEDYIREELMELHDSKFEDFKIEIWVGPVAF